MADLLIYDVQLPTVPSGSDVQSQKLSIYIDGNFDGEITISKSVTVVSGVKVPQNSTVRLELRYIDDAGNMSPDASVVEFVAIDTIPPPTPGQLGVVLIGEEVADNPTANG